LTEARGGEPRPGDTIECISEALEYATKGRRYKVGQPANGGDPEFPAEPTWVDDQGVARTIGPSTPLVLTAFRIVPG